MQGTGGHMYSQNFFPLFGKHVGRFWWQPMVRGDKKRGVLNKDYDVVI